MLLNLEFDENTSRLCKGFNSPTTRLTRSDGLLVDWPHPPVSLPVDLVDEGGGAVVAVREEVVDAVAGVGDGDGEN